jgi:hypothetical protein
LAADSSPISREEATQQYIGYLKYFLRVGSLDLEDLKSLRGFVKTPNPIDLFGSKIHESYIYYEDIEKLLPLVDQKLAFEALDELISEHTSELAQKQGARENTKIITGYFPIQEAFAQDWRFTSSTFRAVDSQLGLISYTLSGTEIDQNLNPVIKNSGKPSIWQFDQGKRVFLNLSKKNRWAEHSSLVSFTDHHYLFSRFKTNVPELLRKGELNKVVLQDLNTGTVVFEVPITQGYSQQIFINALNKPAIAWVKKINRGTKIAAYTRHSEIEPIEEIPLAENATRVLWHVTDEGHLYGLVEVQEQGDTLSAQIIDVTNGGKILYKFSEVSGRYLKFRKEPGKDSFIVVYQNATEKKEPSPLVSYTIKKPNNIWHLESTFSTETPVELFNKLVPLRLSDGGLVFLAWGHGIPLHILKEGKGVIRILDDGAELKNVFERPDGSKVLIMTLDDSDDHLYALESPDFEPKKINLGFPPKQRSNYIGARMLSDGRIIAYFTAVQGDKKYYTSFPVQIYGPFDPKTGEAAP